MSDGSVTIAICTMDRPEILARTMDALEQQSDRDFDVVVVDDSEPADAGATLRAEADPRIRIVRGGRDGLSRARNQAWQEARTDWVVYLDDDVVPESTWLAELRTAMRQHPEAEVVSGRVLAEAPDGADHLVITVVKVEREQVLAGARVRPWHIGLTVAMAIRRSSLERLGGYDERIGPGRTFPSAEDVDFNFRFLRDGGTTFVTPRAVATHVQWRELPALGPHFRGYMIGWAGFAMKTFRQGDRRSGIWLWLLGAEDVLRMGGSAVRRRSGLRSRVAAYKLQGLVKGTLLGLSARW